MGEGNSVEMKAWKGENSRLPFVGNLGTPRSCFHFLFHFPSPSSYARVQENGKVLKFTLEQLLLSGQKAFRDGKKEEVGGKWNSYESGLVPKIVQKTSIAAIEWFLFHFHLRVFGSREQEGIEMKSEHFPNKLLSVPYLSTFHCLTLNEICAIFLSFVL